jgi:hypothetical protein
LGKRLVYVAGTTRSTSEPTTGVSRGVRWTVNVDTGAVVDQTVLSLQFAAGVNGAGDVAGTSAHGQSATLWQSGSYIKLAPPKGGRGGASLGLARTASSPTYVVGGTQTRMGGRAVVWDVN